MMMYEICRAVLTHGGEILAINPEKGIPTIYAQLNNQNYRFSLPRIGQSPPVNTAAVGYISCVINNEADLKSWLTSLFGKQSQEADKTGYDNLPFGPVRADLA